MTTHRDATKLAMIAASLTLSADAMDGVATKELSMAAGPSHTIIRVENNGVDSPRCGHSSSPCRSISQAIANSVAGDTIRVGPGRYGDLDQDGIPGEEGEEKPDNSGCDCMVLIDKKVTVISTHGAAVTLVEAWPLTGVDGVTVTAEGATFGSPDHGFTVVRSAGGISTLADDVRVSGNIVASNATGVFVGGDRNMVDHNLALLNEADGFMIQGEGTIVRSNSAIGGGNGYFLIANKLGVWLNAAIGAGTGFFLEGENTLLRNSAIGNLQSGITIQEGTPANLPKNNIYGNGNLPTYFQELNCGVFNYSSLEISAERSFWGSVSGPGKDPADAICDSPGETLFAPVSRKRYWILSSASLFRSAGKQ